MPAWIVDVVLCLIILGMTYALMSEGLWGSALMFFNVLFASMIAFNFYEPLAGLVAGLGDWASGFADTFCLMVLFIVALVLMRVITESIAPAMVRFPTPVYHIGRILFGFAGSAVTMAFLIVALHTAPVDKKMMKGIDYQYGPPFHQNLDRNWLGFFQYSTGQVFADFGEANPKDPFGEYYNARVFDPYGRWLIDHQNARPHGNDAVPAPAEGEAAAPPPG